MSPYTMKDDYFLKVKACTTLLICTDPPCVMDNQTKPPPYRSQCVTYQTQMKSRNQFKTTRREKVPDPNQKDHMQNTAAKVYWCLHNTWNNKWLIVDSRSKEKIQALLSEPCKLVDQLAASENLSS